MDMKRTMSILLGLTMALGMVTLARGMRVVGQPFTKPLPLDGLA